MKLLFSLFLLLPTFSFADDFKIVATSDFTTTKFSQNELRELYMGLSHPKENGKFIMATHGPLADSSIEKFLSQVLQTDARSFLTYWRIKLFSSRGVPPRKFDSNEQVVKYLETSSQSIGVVSSNTPTGSLKVISLAN